MKKTMFDFDNRREVKEAFKAGNRARKKESVQNTVESVDNMQAQIDLFKKQTGIELEIRDGKPYYDHYLEIIHGARELTSLPDGLTINGSLSLRNCNKMTSLPSDLTIYGNFINNIPDSLLPFFEKLGIKVYGKTHTVRTKDWMAKCHLINQTDEAFKTGNRARKKESVQDAVDSVDDVRTQIELFKEQTGIELEIRDGHPYFDDDLDLGHCTGLTSLPVDLEVKRDLWLNDCIGLTSLPAGLKVKRDLWLENCIRLTSLPDGLKVGGMLWLAGCTGLTSLPFDLIVQGDWIVHKGILTPFFRKLGIPVENDGDTKASYWSEWQRAHGYLTEAFRAGNRARKKEAVQDAQTDNVDTIDNLEDLLDVCDKVVRLYSGKEHQFPKGWVFGTDGSGVNPPEITESPVNDRQYLRNWLVKYRYDFNGSRIRNDLAKEIPGDGNHKFDSDWDLIHSNGRATHLNFDYTVGVMKRKDEDGYRIVFNDGINEVCVYMPGYSRSSFGMALMHLFGAVFMKRYIKAAYYQGVNDPLGDGNYKEAVQMIIRLFTEAVPMSVWKPEQVISVEIGQEPVYNNDFTK